MCCHWTVAVHRDIFKTSWQNRRGDKPPPTYDHPWARLQGHCPLNPLGASISRCGPTATDVVSKFRHLRVLPSITRPPNFGVCDQDVKHEEPSDDGRAGAQRGGCGCSVRPSILVYSGGLELDTIGEISIKHQINIQEPETAGFSWLSSKSRLVCNSCVGH